MMSKHYNVDWQYISTEKLQELLSDLPDGVVLAPNSMAGLAILRVIQTVHGHETYEFLGWINPRLERIQWAEVPTAKGNE
jgi:hypothetical protein